MLPLPKSLLLPALFLLASSWPALAADGFDNNYVGGDANQLFITINGLNRAVLFGPGLMSTGSFFINLSNGTTSDQGIVNSFNLTGAASYMRSAYLDRVSSATLYYRVYPEASTPPGWSTLNLVAQSALAPGTCYSETQNNTWQITGQSLNILQGLPNGHYVMEFYIRAELYDVGLETGNCEVNAPEQCITSETHPGRYLSTRFNTTDPKACDFDDVVAAQSDPAIILFEVNNAPLPVELAYFRGAQVDDQVHLHWGTAHEEDLASFVIESSRDGYQWQVLAQISATGMSGEQQDYHFQDKHPGTGKQYYRLGIIDLYGHMEMSPYIEINIPGAPGDISVWPNPVRETLNMSLPQNVEGILNGRIFNAAGYLVTEFQVESSGVAALPVGNWKEGLYLIEVHTVSENSRSFARFIKTR